MVPQALLKGLLDHFLVDLNVLHLVQVRPSLLMGQLHHVGFIQPAQHLRADLRLLLSRLKALIKGHVKFIIIRLTLYEDHARHVIKLRQGAPAEPLVKRFLQGEELSQGDVESLAS